jgi:hypothetical protein
LRLLQPIESVRRLGILRFIRVDKQGLLAVHILDIGVWDTWLKVKYSIRVKAKGFQDTVNLGILQ